MAHAHDHDAGAGKAGEGRATMGLDPAKLTILQLPIPPLNQFDPSNINVRLLASRRNPNGDTGLVWYRNDVPVLMGVLAQALEASGVMESAIRTVLHLNGTLAVEDDLPEWTVAILEAALSAAEEATS